MTTRLFPIILVVVSCVVYQLAQKSISVAANPFVVVALAYVLGIVACIVLALFAGRPVALAEVRLLSTWPIWILGVSVVGIEVGYLTVYRAGWPLGTAVGITYTLTIVVLAIIGAMFFSETLSIRRVTGLVSAVVGLWLLLGPTHGP